METGDNNPKLEELLCFQSYALNLAFGRYYAEIFRDTGGFTYPKFVVCLALQDAGPMSLGQLSAVTGAEPNTLSPLLKRMAEHGVIERVRSAEDERRIELSLTEFGQKLTNQASKRATQGFLDMGLDPEKVRQATRLMQEARVLLDSVTPEKMQVPTRPED